MERGSCDEGGLEVPDVVYHGAKQASGNPFVAVKPRRIILVRHGESLGNVAGGEMAYVTTPDWLVPLTERGKEQSRSAGVEIQDLVGSSPVYIYVSPYLRTKQTLAGILESLSPTQIVGVREEPRLSEQQFGNFQNAKIVSDLREERNRYGKFFFRFPQGESGLDVYLRVTSFMSTLFREVIYGDSTLVGTEHVGQREDLNIIIVTHGLALRLFLQRWFKHSVLDFERSWNPRNCAVVVMERQERGDEGQGGCFYRVTSGGRTLNMPSERAPYGVDRFLAELREQEAMMRGYAAPRGSEGAGEAGAEALERGS